MRIALNKDGDNLKNIVLFDTSSATLNHGDEIIMESVLKNAKDILDNNYVARFPTHTPCFSFYQQTRLNERFKFVCDSDYKFICGTNIISNHMFFPWPFWNINIFNSKCYKNAVLVGVGVAGFKDGDDKVSFYSKLLFSRFLSKQYKHSVRDERTKRIVESICGAGSAINTGCPTLWGLTKKHCSEIPVKKAPSVVFTLTDYAANRETDQYLIDVLTRTYETVYFWPQGTRDIKVFESLNNTENIKMITPSVKAYSDLLSKGNIDYVGTRLHAGIYAMQHKVRSLILIVDNRAADMGETYNINTIKRYDKNLENIINSEIVTNINIDEEKINAWKSQFLE